MSLDSPTTPLVSHRGSRVTSITQHEHVKTSETDETKMRLCISNMTWRHTGKAELRPETHYPHVTWVHVMLTRAVGDVRGDLTLKSMAQIHTSVTLLTSRDLAWSSGRLTCQHASQISAVAHISWEVTHVSRALQTLPVVSRNGGNAY